MEHLGYHWIYLRDIWYLRIFQKSVGKNKVSLKMTAIKGTLHEDQYTFWLYLAHFFLEWEMSQTKVVEKIQTHFTFNNFFLKSCRLWDNVEKYGRARQEADNNMAHVHCTLDTWGYKHTLRIVMIMAFPLQQWLRERTSILRYACIPCLVCIGS